MIHRVHSEGRLIDHIYGFMLRLSKEINNYFPSFL